MAGSVLRLAGRSNLWSHLVLHRTYLGILQGPTISVWKDPGHIRMVLHDHWPEFGLVFQTQPHPCQREDPVGSQVDDRMQRRGLAHVYHHCRLWHDVHKSYRLC